jgi:hypothetical protein
LPLIEPRVKVEEKPMYLICNMLHRPFSERVREIYHSCARWEIAFSPGHTIPVFCIWYEQDLSRYDSLKPFCHALAILAERTVSRKRSFSRSFNDVANYLSCTKNETRKRSEETSRSA